MIQITESIAISENEIKEEFIRSTGPGGQNVNKVSTAVQLRFDAANSPNLPPDVISRLLHLAASRKTDAGIIIIKARRYRSQEKNRQDALDRLIELIRAAAIKPKIRKKTKPPPASKVKRLEKKRRLSDKKKSRKSPRSDD